MTEAAARAHIDRFNAAVTSGDWSPFVATLHPDAVMTFIGRPVGPFVGRDEIMSAYAADPPHDTMRVLAIEAGGKVDMISFEWSRGGTATLILHRDAGQITRLSIQLDRPPGTTDTRS